MSPEDTHSTNKFSCNRDKWTITCKTTLRTRRISHGVC